MIIIRLKGGLGNQMFQYAFAKGIAKRLGTSFKIDCSLLLDRARAEQVVYRDFDLHIFNIENDQIISPTFLRSLYKIRIGRLGKMIRNHLAKGRQYEKEKHFHVDQPLLENPIDNAVYDGWWQSPLYWNNLEKELKEDFSFKEPFLPSSVELVSNIEENNSICLNVRRTDFVTNPTLNATNLEYFKKGIQKMNDLVEDPHYFVFSDDLKWCEENLTFDAPFTIVGHEHKGVKFGNYLRLMSRCKHFIIPNSSFAWWAVWLSDYESKNVIAPKNWFNSDQYITTDLIPKEWDRL